MANTLSYDVTQTAATNPITSAPAAGGSLGKDEFLQLLVTQLKYQDPMKPMEDTQFISQMAQFSSLEQMQNLNNSFTTNKALGMIGKSIISIDAEGKEIKGIVDSVKVSGSKAYAVVDGADISIDSIKEIYDAVVNKTEEATESTETAKEELIDLSKYTGLIDKSVNAIVKGVTDDGVYQLTGDVNAVSIIQNQPIITLNGINAKIDSLVLGDQSEVVTSTKDYIQSKLGSEMTAVVVDEAGNKTQITGKISLVSGDDANPDVVFNGVMTTVDSIYQIMSGDGQ